MHQLFMFLRGFSPVHKNCKKLFSDKILYRWYKYISLQNYLIKLTPNVWIKMYRLYTWHVHRSWWFRHLLQSSIIDINNRNIFILFLTLKSSNKALLKWYQILNIAQISNWTQNVRLGNICRNGRSAVMSIPDLTWICRNGRSGVMSIPDLTWICKNGRSGVLSIPDLTWICRNGRSGVLSIPDLTWICRTGRSGVMSIPDLTWICRNGRSGVMSIPDLTMQLYIKNINYVEKSLVWSPCAVQGIPLSSQLWVRSDWVPLTCRVT